LVFLSGHCWFASAFLMRRYLFSTTSFLLLLHCPFPVLAHSGFDVYLGLVFSGAKEVVSCFSFFVLVFSGVLLPPFGRMYVALTWSVWLMGPSFRVSDRCLHTVSSGFHFLGFVLADSRWGSFSVSPYALHGLLCLFCALFIVL